MTRVVSLFLPTWSTDRLRRKAGDAAPPPEAPLVLVGREGRRRVVLAADAAAQAAGLRVGMPAAKAQVLVPGLVVRDADPAADAEALERLALWVLQRYAPIVAADPPDGIVIDSTGADHLHGGEAGNARRAGRAAGRCPASPPAPPSPTAGAPRMRSPATPPGRPSLRRAGQRPPRSPALAARSPAAAERMSLRPARARLRAHRRLARAAPRAARLCVSGLSSAGGSTKPSARLAEPIEPIRPPDLIEVRRAFAEPIGAAETIARYIGKLVVQLCAALEAQGSRCPAARSDLSPRRQPRPGRPRRHGDAGRAT